MKILNHVSVRDDKQYDERCEGRSNIVTNKILLAVDIFCQFVCQFFGALPMFHEKPVIINTHPNRNILYYTTLHTVFTHTNALPITRHPSPLNLSFCCNIFPNHWRMDVHLHLFFIPSKLQFSHSNNVLTRNFTAQKMKFSSTDFFSKCDQSRRKLRIWSHLLKKSVMENFIFRAVLMLLWMNRL